MQSILASPKQQRALSHKIEDCQFSVLFEVATLADRARLLSTSAPHASSRLLVTPATGLDLHLEPNELQTAVKWWLGVDTARETLCPDTALDQLGNHAATCKRGGDVVSRHNRLRYLVLEFCRRAHQVVRVEKGSGLTPDHSRTHPADILALNWDRGRHAAFDVIVTSPLSVSILSEASMSVGAAFEAEVPMTPSALSWGGFVSHSLRRHIVTGAKKLTPPSPALHPALPQLLKFLPP